MSWIDKTGWSTGDVQDWKTTTTTTGDPFTIKMPKYTIKEPVVIPTIEPIGTVNQGWLCPKCGRVNAPGVASCSCNGSIFKKIDTWTETGIPEACRNCSNHPSNGGSGICNCTLGTPIVTC